MIPHLDANLIGLKARITDEEQETTMMAAHFVQECPVCGRPLHISWTYQGGKVVCHHCRGFLWPDTVLATQDVSMIPRTRCSAEVSGYGRSTAGNLKG